MPKRPEFTYVMPCVTCGKEISVRPHALEGLLARCPHCGEANSTPVTDLLSGRRPTATGGSDAEPSA
jgi:DNA-directed RNA polymerase subunit RPC12/RpoP